MKNKPTKGITGKDVEKFISKVPWIKRDKPTKELDKETEQEIIFRHRELKPTKECKHERKFRDSKGKCFLCDEEWTKECKHDISGNMDNEYCSKCGMKYGHRYPQQSILSTILKEADNAIEKFLDAIYHYQCCDHREQIKSKIKPILHSKIELAYKAGQEDNDLESLLAESFRSGTGVGIRQTIKQIEEWLDNNIRQGINHKVIRKYDIKKFINTL